VLRRLSWGLALVVAGGAAVAAAFASGAAPTATSPTFALVQFPTSECSPPKVIFGKACLDRSGLILSEDWTYRDGSATWHPTGWTTTYKWSLPATVTAAGAAITMALTAAGKQRGSICPSITARGGLPLKRAGQSSELTVCATRGKHASDSKTVTVVPASSGPVYVLIGLEDGPQFIYKYRKR
jgi:hypothetical protein